MKNKSWIFVGPNHNQKRQLQLRRLGAVFEKKDKKKESPFDRPFLQKQAGIQKETKKRD